MEKYEFENFKNKKPLNIVIFSSVFKGTAFGVSLVYVMLDKIEVLE